MLAISYGPAHVVSVARQQGPGQLFGVGSQVLSDIGQSLFLTSLFAAMIAFHSAVGRYLFPLGRERVLPRWLGRPGPSGAPVAASLVQLFFYLGTTGGFGVLVLAAATSIAVIVFFARDRRGESLWSAVIAPVLSAAALVVMVWLVV